MTACYNKLNTVVKRKRKHAYVADVLLLETIQKRCLLCCTGLTCAVFHFYKQDSATNTKIHKQKFKTGSQTTPFQQAILKLTTKRVQWVHKHSLLTPVNSQSNS
jgi:hypothetical protein